MRRAVAVVALALALVSAAPGSAAERVRVGVLKLTSSAPLFVGVEKGFFRAHGIEPELVYFQAAAPIATAVAAGQLDVGATGLTAALYNIVLGGEKLWIVADKGRDWPGFPLNAIVVHRDLWEAGVRSVEALRGRRVGVTQLGSTFHYQIGNILEQHGLSVNDVRIVPLQAMGAALEALKGRQVEVVVLPQPFPGRAEAEGFGRIVAWAGDLFPWQISAIFYAKGFAADRRRALEFMKGYVRSSRFYHDAIVRDGRPGAGPHYEELVAITARYTGAAPEIIRLGFPYQDRDGRLLVEDIGRQMQWWVRHGFLKTAVPLREIVDPSFVEAAVAALRE